MTLTDFSFLELTPEFEISEFQCGEDEITKFLLEDSKDYQKEMMANTYLFLKDDRSIAAYFCISNDCLNDKGEEKGFTNKIFNRLHRKLELPNGKRIRQYPSVKVGRLGVALEYHKTGLAYELMDFIKGFSLINHKPACRLLLLDAINKERQIKYYRTNGFEFLLDNDVNEENRLMFFDLLPFK